MKNKQIITGFILGAALILISGCSSETAKNEVPAAQPTTASIVQNSTTQPQTEESVTQPQTAAETIPEMDFEYKETDGTITIESYRGSDKEIVIPAQIEGKDVTVMGDYCFANKRITKVVCPDTLETIEEFAFINCDELCEIQLNEGLKTIEKDAFLHCKSLEYVSLPSTLLSMGELCFNGAGVKEIDFQCNSVEWEYGGFCNIAITELKIPSNVKRMGDSMFIDCKTLESVLIEEGVEKLGKGTFANCSNLKNVFLPASITEIGEDVFYDTSADLVLTVQPGSYAQEYAIANNITYITLENETTINTELPENSDDQREEIALSASSRTISCSMRGKDQKRYKISFQVNDSFKEERSHSGEVEMLCTYAPNEAYGMEGPVLCLAIQFGDEVYSACEEFKERGTFENAIEVTPLSGRFYFKAKMESYDDIMYFYGFDCCDGYFENGGICIVYPKEYVGTENEEKLMRVLDEAVESYEEEII